MTKGGRRAAALLDARDYIGATRPWRALGE